MLYKLDLVLSSQESIKQTLLLSSFLNRQIKWGSERLEDLPKVKVTQQRVVEPGLKLRSSDGRT